MENRRFVLALIFLALGFFIAIPSNVFAYAVETHGYLTKAIVDFYNKNYSQNKISDELAAFLVDGARLEDNVPRYFNHFYDPVHNRGLADKIYSGMASKLWAQDEKEQTALIYRIIPQTEIPTLLTALQIQKIDPIFHKDDFTWQKAVELYTKGEKEQALYALGHTLHLIEDASVPDHTRNDSHPPFDDGVSPYENWTERFSLKNYDFDLANRLRGKKPVALSSLNEYFDGIANYSNNNFYSKDSIKNYELPKADYIEKDGAYVYAFKKDDQGPYRLAKVINPKSEYEWNNPTELSLSDIQQLSIMPDYWNRLSVKAVQYGAGVMNLFFEEAEQARQKYLAKKSQRPYLATLVDGVNSIFGNAESQDVSDLVNEFKLVEEIPIEKPAPVIASKAKQSQEIATPTTEVGARDDNEDNGNGSTSSPNNSDTEQKNLAPEQKICSFATSQMPSRQNLIINEVAWMGSANSASDEWIELKNISGNNLDVANWQILDMSEQIKVKLSGQISAGGFYLLERTDDNSVPNIPADQIYTGALANTGEGLRLFDKDCNLIDEAMASPDWPAGDNNFKYTMERSPVLSWRSYGGSGVGGIYGTPKSENSPGIPQENTANINEIPSSPKPKPVIQPYVIPEEAGIQTGSQPQKILISEILFDVEGSDDGKEFIELYNPNDQAVDISSWSIQQVTASGNLTKKNFESGDSIAAKSFFLIGGTALADLPLASGSLNNTSATIYLANNTEPVSTTSPVSNALDTVNYNIANLSGFSAGQSLERKALVDGACTTPRGSGEYLGNGCEAVDFEIRDIPDPQNTQSLPEPSVIPAEAGIQDSGSQLEAGMTSEPVEGITSGISNVLFSKDGGGNFLSFTLNDTIHENDNNAIHYILAWVNSDPKEMTVPNRSSGIAPNWAGYCPTTGNVSGNEGSGGTGFDNYVMPNYEPTNKPPIYDPNQQTYSYKVYFTETCPNAGFSGGKDLKGELTSEDFVTLGLWIYYANMGIIDEGKSVNYTDRHYFQLQI